MKKISNYPVNSENQDFQQQPEINHGLQNRIPDEVKELVDHVFRQLSVIFPAWRVAWKGGNDQETAMNVSLAKKEWTKSFFENGINTTEHIRYGLAKARKSESDFLPSCGKFVTWCKPSPDDLGIPSFETAYRHATKSTWSHQIVYELFKRVGQWDFTYMSDKALRAACRPIYDDIVKEVISGEFNPEKPKPKNRQIENKAEPKKKYTMTHKKAMEQMRKSLGCYKS